MTYLLLASNVVSLSILAVAVLWLVQHFTVREERLQEKLIALSKPEVLAAVKSNVEPIRPVRIIDEQREFELERQGNDG